MIVQELKGASGRRRTQAFGLLMSNCITSLEGEEDKEGTRKNNRNKKEKENEKENEKEKKNLRIKVKMTA